MVGRAKARKTAKRNKRIEEEIKRRVPLEPGEFTGMCRDLGVSFGLGWEGVRKIAHDMVRKRRIGKRELGIAKRTERGTPLTPDEMRYLRTRILQEWKEWRGGGRVVNIKGIERRLKKQRVRGNSLVRDVVDKMMMEGALLHPTAQRVLDTRMALGEKHDATSVKRAANILGISTATLRYRMEKMRAVEAVARRRGLGFKEALWRYPYLKEAVRGENRF